MLQRIVTGCDDGFSLTSMSLLGSSVLLISGFLTSPLSSVLCEVPALFLCINSWPEGTDFLLAGSVWPGNRVRTCGTKLQCGWSSATVIGTESPSLSLSTGK